MNTLSHNASDAHTYDSRKSLFTWSQGARKGTPLPYNGTSETTSSMGGASPCGRPGLDVDTHDTSDPYINIVGLKKSYGLKPVLRGIDISIRAGESVALLGANGTGKTTLLRILAGLTRPNAGSVTIAGYDLLREPQRVRRLVGFVAHQPYLYEELTALENLLFFGRMYTVEHAQERAVQLLQRVELEKRMRERVSTLSRGQVQRLAWARALLHEPRLLLLDEPDTGLDQEGYTLMNALLHEHTIQGGTTLFTTHSLERALSLSTSILILNKGRVVYRHTTEGLVLEELQRVYKEAVLA